MKKLDVLILKTFIGPFVLTTVVSTFILLTQYMLKYFDDFVGKDLGPEVFAELIMYFSINMMPVAIPLGVLLSSLMTFGNLGEHFELTAIKSAGISLIRALVPIGAFVLLLTIGTFFFNNHVVPRANLSAYSLLYDIKNTKPALDIREGQFYDGIDGYSIKVKKKYPDNRTLKDVIIYDHTKTVKIGNKTVILADSAIMYTVLNDRYLKFELYSGNVYDETTKGARRRRLNSRYIRNKFGKMEMMFDLSSFGKKDTDKDLFQNNRQMKNISELTHDIDSLGNRIKESKNNLAYGALAYYKYHFKEELNRLRDSTEAERKKADELKRLERQQKKRDEERELDLQENRKPEMLENDKFLHSDTVEIIREKTAEDTVVRKASLFSLPGIFKQRKPQPVQQQPKLLKQDSIKRNVRIPINPNIKLKAPAIDSTEESEGSKVTEIDPEDTEEAGSTVDYQQAVNSARVKDTTSIKKAHPRQQVPKLEKDKIIKLDTMIVTLMKDSIDAYYTRYPYKKADVLSKALNKVKNVRNGVRSVNRRVKSDEKNIDKYTVEKYKKYSQAFACIVMFLIGAPLGSIIKKGGLGVPVIVSIFFFIIYYVLNITSEKWAKEGLVDGAYAVWYANIFLLPFGFYFLSRAKVDARLFELDSYLIWFQQRFRKRKKTSD